MRITGTPPTWATAHILLLGAARVCGDHIILCPRVGGKSLLVNQNGYGSLEPKWLRTPSLRNGMTVVSPWRHRDIRRHAGL
mmetsp:Transcript_10591/g.8221  ORF Transcript_10591/g.8221 Transcript_10591/m.8221 type:complete len:81 (-) Transcript_10591:174-416(-)